ncbi:hypothetical protein BDR03DRAFT_928942 [Suillus americanus]|nr:hypothetical protein BDR03DRAFT_928942 [Suillus americanus]
MLPLVLYDILSELPGNYWSANPAKPRSVLRVLHANYKELPFVTLWVEYLDISIAMKSIGAKPVKRRNGSDVYTIPVLSDPNTGALITDSLEIVSYLEKTYPEKPIFPNSSEPLIRAFDSAYMSLILPGFKPMLPRTIEILSPASAKFFIRILSLLGETRWEAVSEENAQQQWENLKKGLDEIDKWYQKSGGKWIMGDTFSFADMVVACRTMWWNTIFDEEQLRELHSWNGGRWASILADVNAECGTDL